ncbi:MAG: hypothetical protein SCALA702_29390 [Melioribacteraceae bacterium]|nr:MAG: hypothetical protein SCALA702_29390 [Melioribacteraceae bacterium]
MKTAIVHEWFVNYMGSEKCVESFTNIWDKSDIFALVDYLTSEERSIILKGKTAETSFIQKLPGAKKRYRNYLPFFPLAVEQFDLSSYDVVISSSHAVAKGVLTGTNQMHVCYCHTPVRYAWDLYNQYLREANLTTGIKGLFARIVLHYFRMWDISSVNRVDHFVANSRYIARRIKKVYNREATVIYPPVDVDKFGLNTNKEDFYLAVARFVPYKKMDLIVEAFTKMPDKTLYVIGSGPDEAKIKALAGQNIKFLGYQSDDALVDYMGRAKSFVFAAEEDFGITNVEAMACGTPVIAYGKGGATETIIPGETGYFFEKQSPESLIKTVEEFERMGKSFNPVKIREHSEKFSRKRFEEEIESFVKTKYEDFRKSL